MKGELKGVGRTGDPGDIPTTGGQGFILTAQTAATVDIFGEGWTTDSTTAAAPLSLTGIEVGNITPMLALSGEVSGVNRGGFPCRCQEPLKSGGDFPQHCCRGR